jgi:hypothetical protein
MQRNNSVGLSSAWVRLGLLILLGAVALDGMGRALAQDNPGDPVEDEVSAAPRAYFQLFADGVEDDIGFDSMSAAEQDALMLMAERTDDGPAVHAAWSAIARQAAANAAATRAARAAGIQGLDELGVE